MPRANKSAKSKVQKARKIGDNLKDNAQFQQILDGLGEDPTDWERYGVAADFCEDHGEYELMLALRWMAAHKKYPERSLTAGHWNFGWRAKAPGASFNNLWVLFRNRNWWGFDDYFMALVFLATHLAKKRRELTVPGDIGYGL